MNTKSLVAAVAGVLMVGATTVGAGLAMANDEPVRVESESVSVVEAAPSTYVDDEYDEYDEYNEYEDEATEEDEAYEAADAYGEAHDDEYGEEYDEDEYEREHDEHEQENEHDEYEDLDEAEGGYDDD